MSCCSDVMEPIAASSCCTPQDTAAQAARAIRDSGCGCAPVVEDTENLKLVGVVTERDTERDVCCGVAADDHRLSRFASKSPFVPHLRVVARDEQVTEAHRKLDKHRATSLPVVDKAGGCCGTVSVHSFERS